MIFGVFLSKLHTKDDDDDDDDGMKKNSNENSEIIDSHFFLKTKAGMISRQI